MVSLWCLSLIRMHLSHVLRHTLTLSPTLTPHGPHSNIHQISYSFINGLSVFFNSGMSLPLSPVRYLDISLSLSLSLSLSPSVSILNFILLWSHPFYLLLSISISFFSPLSHSLSLFSVTLSLYYIYTVTFSFH